MYLPLNSNPLCKCKFINVIKHIVVTVNIIVAVEKFDSILVILPLPTPILGSFMVILPSES